MDDMTRTHKQFKNYFFLSINANSSTTTSCWILMYFEHGSCLLLLFFHIHICVCKMMVFCDCMDMCNMYPLCITHKHINIVFFFLLLFSYSIRLTVLLLLPTLLLPFGMAHYIQFYFILFFAYGVVFLFLICKQHNVEWYCWS